MRTIRVILAALIFAGCGAPEPIPLGEMEERDFRPAPDSAPAASAREILARDEITLPDALAAADALNPHLAAERRNVDLAEAALWEARLYPNPSLLLEVEDYRTRDGATTGKMERTAGVAVPLVLSGRIGKAASLAEAERQEAALRYLWRRREILGDTKRAFVTLLSARQAADLARETRDLARAVRDASEERFKAQAVPEMEVLKASVALARTEIDLRTAGKEAAVALKSLHALLGDADRAKDRFSGELHSGFRVPPIEDLRARVATAHPLVEAAAKAREAAELELALARAERLPDLQLEVLAGKDPEDASILEAGLSIPLPLFNRNQGRIARAQARIRQAEARARAVRDDLLLRLAEAHGNFLAAQDQVKAYREEILPQAEKALGQTSEGYRLGKFTYLDLTDAQRTFAEARAAGAAALAELNLAAADLEKLTGTILEPIR